ncbi:GNAT family N-acetyltransferase [Brachybacterium sp. MASK1Z-5]|uniref:GNAT family N-acetyltransferase n=1 Tax=Brachybacterium halotolerans TaxID=2795215 RepID=A0ABS1B6Z0_9MICO|nr:GNAT family N-acetyltransferase [Brachybacterium halotolerans]MBK0330292.1 GNAT family N-acetyltransferase [Brachybacterium halotolerans]
MTDDIRALTLIVTDPSAAAAALHSILDWEIEADFGTFASLTPATGIPLWLNAPADGEATSSGIVLHLTADDVDRAFTAAVDRGARAVRAPQDMDFGERSASVALTALPGVTLDFSHPITPSPGSLDATPPQREAGHDAGSARVHDGVATDRIEIRPASPGDVEAIRDFGADVIPAHYGPIIGEDAAQGQVDRWWTRDAIERSVFQGHHVVAIAAGRIVGVAERGRHGRDHVLYKLYLAPEARGHGLGPRLVDSIIEQLPVGTERLLTEHFAGNTRAAAFYAREGFVEDHIEPHPSGDVAQDTVWRVRDLGQAGES